MEITVNGETKRVEPGTTLAELLGNLGIDRSARGVAVAVNDSVITQSSWREKELSRGDTIEIIQAVQGG